MNRLRKELQQSDIETSHIFTSDEEILDAKKVLGELASEIPEDDLKNTITEIHFLAESWLDDFERQAFGGKTLQELLSKGNKP
jgi:hypothetical protein